MKRLILKLLDATFPPRLRKPLLHLAYHLEPAEFERFAHAYCIAPSMIFGLRSLAQRGFSPRTIVDVGAYEGSWTTLTQSIWPGSKPIMIEANRAKIDALRKIGETHCELLGAKQGEAVTFNIMETGSSVLNENSGAPRDVEMRTLSTLDSLSLDIQPHSLLKIDAQGYELEILKGAQRSLNYFDAVLLEVALIEINDGAPLLAEVLAFMGPLGFVACDILEIHRRPLDSATSQIDILFARAGSKLLLCRSFD
jgi:FkbM family methyltransferase